MYFINNSINAIHAWIYFVYIGVSTVTDTPISSISISSSSTIVSTSLISSTQEIMPTSSNAVPKDRPTGILIVLCCYIMYGSLCSYVTTYT